MAKKGTCCNCERPNMYLPAFGRCYLCYDVVKKLEKAGATDEKIAEALAEVRERIKSGVNLKSNRGGRKLTNTGPAPQGESLLAAALKSAEGFHAKPVETPAAAEGDPALLPPEFPPLGQQRLVTYKLPGILITGLDGVCLEFVDDRDKAIRARVMDMAKDARRGTSQQILWMLGEFIKILDARKRVFGTDNLNMEDWLCGGPSKP